MAESSSIIIIVCLFLSYSGMTISGTELVSSIFRETFSITVTLALPKNSSPSVACSIDNSGRITVKVVISLSTLVTVISPSNNFTILLHIAKPNPFRDVSCALFWSSKLSSTVYLSKILERSSSLIPLPVLATTIYSFLSSTYTSTLIFPLTDAYLKALDIRLVIILFKHPESEFQYILSTIFIL